MRRALALASIVPAIAGAQVTNADTAPVAPASACELHVWPAPGLETSSQGWVSQNSRNRDLRDEQGRPTALATALRPAQQLAVLGAMPLATLLGIADAKVVLHADPAPRTPAGSVAPRRADTGAACYAEFVVRNLTFARAPLTRSALHAVIQFRAFAGGAAPARSFSTLVDAPLFDFAEPDGTRAAFAAADVDEALRADVRAFAAALRAPPRKPR